jgi:hypothetical protein
MAQKEIMLLKQQLAELANPDFDLDAWKQHTIIFLERIFGKDSTKIQFVKDLHYDYSSWSLRDTAAVGKTKGKDPVKTQAEEIIEAAILELETLGLPEGQNDKGEIMELLSDELTGKQMKEIEAVIGSANNDSVAKISEILSYFEKERLAEIIAKLILK